MKPSRFLKFFSADWSTTRNSCIVIAEFVDRVGQLVRALAEPLPHLLAVGRRLCRPAAAVDRRLLLQRRLRIERRLTSTPGCAHADRRVAEDFIERGHRRGELAHRALGRVEQSLTRPCLADLVAERLVERACQLGNFVAGLAERLGSPAAKSCLQVAKLASESNGLRIHCAVERSCRRPPAARRRQCRRLSEIDRRIAEHGRANVRLVVGIQRPIAIDFGLEQHAVVLVFDRLHAADQECRSCGPACS